LAELLLLLPKLKMKALYSCFEAAPA